MTSIANQASNYYREDGEHGTLPIAVRTPCSMVDASMSRTLNLLSVQPIADTCQCRPARVVGPEAKKAKTV